MLILDVYKRQGCIGSDVLTINLTDNADPTITCPVGPIVMNTDVDSCNAVVCFPITTSDDCPFYYPPTLTDLSLIHISSLENKNPGKR